MTEFSIPGPALLAAAAWVERVVPSRPVVPVLAGVVLDAADRLTMTTFDYETSAVATVGAVVTAPGRILVPAHPLADIAKAAGKGQVALSADDSRLTLRAGRNEWTLPLLPMEDYPTLPSGEGDPVTLSGTDLRAAVARVTAVLDPSRQPAVLTGIYATAAETGDGLVLCGSDGYRFAESVVPTRNGTWPGPAVLPPDALVAAAKSGAEVLHLACDGHTFTVTSEDHRVVGRLLGGDYPYRQIQNFVPASPVSVVQIPAAELSRAVDAATVMAEEVALLRFAVDTDEITVSAVGDERSARAVAEGAKLDGDPITVGLRTGYLRTALAGMGDGDVELSFDHSPNRAVLFRPVDEPGVRHAVMPRKLPQEDA